MGTRRILSLLGEYNDLLPLQSTSRELPNSVVVELDHSPATSYKIR